MSTAINLSNWLKLLPNKLTIGRIAAIPILMIFFPFDVAFTNSLCALVFGAAAITDFFDGYLARKYGTTSRLGALLDPVADKLLVTAALVLLTNSGRVPAFLVVLLLSRDIAVSGIRLIASEQNLSIGVSQLGKVKTAVLDVAIFCLIFERGFTKLTGMGLIWVALGLSLYSGYLYGRGFWQSANLSDDKADASTRN